jgi:DNA invertase Pin-like site-specific DNA recombinase
MLCRWLPRDFTDVASGAQAEREGLAQALRFLRKGDSLVLWKLDRLGRSLKDLIVNVTTLQERQGNRI